MKLLTMKGRTHRLCTHADMLESFLHEQTLLTDDDVMELLRSILHQWKLHFHCAGLASYPIVDLPSGNTLPRRMFPSDKFAKPLLLYHGGYIDF